MRYVVGYVPNQRGVDAVTLAATLAGSRGATLDVIVVMPTDEPSFDMYSPDRAYHEELEIQGREWLADAMALVPAGVQASGHVLHAESIAEGLIHAVFDPGLGDEAGLIVIGASEHGLKGRFTAGSIASAVLHAAPVPVALAPAEYEGQPEITRITCAIGTRPGAHALLAVAIDMAGSRGIPLRLMSLVAMDQRRAGDERAARIAKAQRHAETLVEQARQHLPERCPVTSVIGEGSSLEDCVSALDFADSEIVLVGSSRLAGPRRIFIGASASKMLRALPVPMIVVPREGETSP